MYDVFLFSGCKSTPTLDEIRIILPEYQNTTFIKKLTSPSPGFLGVSLESLSNNWITYDIMSSPEQT
jgi:hypothetical protein